MLQTQSTASINNFLGNLTAAERLRWADFSGGDGVVVTTSFGQYSAVMLHLVKINAPKAQILSVDTGVNVETIEFSEQLTARLGLRVQRYKIPDECFLAEDPEVSLRLIKEHKVRTLERALEQVGAKIWVSGVQKHETPERENFKYLMKREDGLLKLHPILHWREEQLASYCKQNNLPINHFYLDPAKGHSQKTECGIHLSPLADESLTASQL